MFSAFLNPFTLIVGGALVLTPIIIHLINRIRYRRVRWAAMEFLLKAQKRMRRRKILEQLLLLLMRCLLVFLAGFLFARFIGCDWFGEQGATANETRPTTHIVILDDSPSMADGWRREDGTQTDALKEGKRLITEKLMPATAEATTAQTMHLVRLSALDKPFPETTKEVDGKLVPRGQEEIRSTARVNAKAKTDMEAYLHTVEVSTVRQSLIAGLNKAKQMLDQSPAGDAKVIHIISDLRAVDWNQDGPAITDLLRELKESGVTVHLIDVANPARKPDRKSPPFSDNVSIVELKPRNRVVSVNQQTEIEVRVKNYGSTDLKDVGILFYLNEQGNIITSMSIPTLPANQERSQTVMVTFSQPGAKVGTKEKPLDRFNLITAALSTPEPGGIAVDNARHTIVEVRDTVKVLVVDGRTLENGVDIREKPEGDSYYLRKLLGTKDESLGNIEVVSGEFNLLDKMDLRPFTTIYLMNVPTLSDAAVKNLERYISQGGGVGVFLGPNVKPDDYNTKMHRGAAGFFPVPLPGEPSEDLTPEQKLTRELAFAKRLLLRLPSNRSHPALRRIYLNERGEPTKADDVEKYFHLANIDKHWPVSRRGAWRDDKSIQELYCLQNEASIATFQQRAEDLVAEIRKRYNEPKFQTARQYLDPLMQKIRETPTQPLPLSILARLLDQLLCDQINDGDESEPVLRDFWQQPEMADTKKQAMILRDEAKYGDPLYVVRQFGRGRVAVMTTDAGGTFTGKKQWNDWPSLGGGAGWAIIVGEMQKYLAGGGDDLNRAVGSAFTADFDYDRYEPLVQAHFLSADASKPSTERKIPVVLKEIGKLTMDSPATPTDAPDAPKRPYRLSLGDTAQPGAYLFTLARKKEAGAPVLPPTGKPDPFADVDFVGVAFNVDAITEGDLRRANTDDIAQLTSKAPLHNTEDLSWLESLKQKPSDMSSGRWLYLVILLLLIAEQAWAVRISYHTKPEDLEAHAPSAAAAYAHHSTPLPSTSGEAAESGTAPADRS